MTPDQEEELALLRDLYSNTQHLQLFLSGYKHHPAATSIRRLNTFYREQRKHQREIEKLLDYPQLKQTQRTETMCTAEQCLPGGEFDMMLCELEASHAGNHQSKNIQWSDRQCNDVQELSRMPSIQRTAQSVSDGSINTDFGLPIET